MVRKLLALLFFLLCGLFLPAVSHAAPLRVALAGSKPFVINEDGIWTGIAVSIWEQIADENQWTFQYHPYKTTQDAMAALTAGREDILVGDTVITSARMKVIEFSQPYFRSGLQIMVAEARPHTPARLWENIRDWLFIPTFWYIVATVIIFTLAVTFFEKKHNPDFPKTLGAGIAEAFYYVMSLTLTNKSAYKGFPGVLGRMMLVFWMILGVVMVACLNATITTAMTVEQLRSHINGPQDLRGKTVGVLADSAAAMYLRVHGVTYKMYPSLDDAVAALAPEKGQPGIECIVGDAPILRAFDFNHPQLPITEIEPVFAGFSYAFALPIGSPLRIDLNASLARGVESGVWLRNVQKYLGEEYQP